jgi:hypothetical protein
MIKLFLDSSAAHGGWRLVNRTPRGSDLLARAASGADDPSTTWEQLALLAESDRIRIVRGPDGHWGWILTWPDGTPAVECPAVHRDAEACRWAFADARRAARSLRLHRGGAAHVPRRPAASADGAGPVERAPASRRAAAESESS